METPVQISFRHLTRSEGVVRKIYERVTHLEVICSYLISCRVVVELMNRRHHRGNLFQVIVDLKLPGAEIVGSRDSGLNHAHEDAYVAVRDAFDSIEKQLENYVQYRRIRVHLRHRDRFLFSRL